MRARRSATTWWQAVAACTALGLGVAAWTQETGPATQPTPPAQTPPGAAPAEEDEAFRFGPRRPVLNASTLTDEDVVRAMQRGVDYLLSVRDGDDWEEVGQREAGEDDFGLWGGGGGGGGRRFGGGRGGGMGGRGRGAFGGGWNRLGGETALAVFALLHAGQSLQDDPVYGPKLHFRSKDLGPSVEWLTRLNTQSTYIAALQASALSLLPKKPDEKPGEGPQAALQRNYRYLVTAMGHSGGYTYRVPEYQPLQEGEKVPTFGDLSNAQYGALGMWALEEAGIPAPAGYWQKTDRFWRAMQRQNGSWPYRASVDALVDRDSMGLAGIATLYITREFTDRTARSTPREDRALENAMAWLNGRFSSNFGDLYSMYTVERIGLASGLRYLGNVDWYRELAANIIAHQRPNGSWTNRSWPAEYATFAGANDVTATSFALLFLARGRNPIVFNKLQYDGPWDARPMDVAFLTRWMSKKFERPLNWQVVNLRMPARPGGSAPATPPGAGGNAPSVGDPREWLDAPILIITGSKDPGFTPADIAKLRTFIDSGGMIFSQSNEASAGFTAVMRNAADQVVNGRYEMRRLPREHFLYNTDLNVSLEGAPQLLGMNNGVREVWVHCPVDIAASWQTKRTTAKVHFDIPAALYFYQTGKAPLRARLKAPLAPPTPPTTSTQSQGRRATLARVMFSGNSDPEPGAWPRLAEALRANTGYAIDLKIVPVLPSELDPAVYPVAHMTGTASFLVKEEDTTAVRKYLDGGGTLIADAAGGNEPFMKAMRELVHKTYPEARVAPLPPDHPVYTGAFAAEGGGGGVDVRKVNFRRYGREVLKRDVTEPEIEGVSVNGRVRVLLSKYDITSGLLGSQTWGIVGYAPESAEKLAANLVRFALDKPAEGNSGRVNEPQMNTNEHK